jgi:ribosomal-protein-alanine N-acetyltransferase
VNRTIETPRLLLRPLALEDAEDVFEWVSDPIVNRYMPYALYRHVSEVKDWILSLDEKENTFAFVLRETGKVIGSGSVSFDEHRNAYKLGYNLNRAYWGKGYATEASRAMIQWAYSQLGARDFCANHATVNIASGNVMRKCGLSFERYGHYARFDGSETFDAAFYRLHLD